MPHNTIGFKGFEMTYYLMHMRILINHYLTKRILWVRLVRDGYCFGAGYC